MCGIAAYVGRSQHVDIGLVRQAATQLGHRGPDDTGVEAIGDAVVAQRRLSIIDVTGGHQPLRNEDGTWRLVCNGEIYNHVELRAQLQARHHFSTRSDSEVILHLFEDLGPDCVTRLDGMFAFVMTNGEQVFAARDPLGIKPLYTGRDREGGLWFASEIKALIDVCEHVEEFPPGSIYTEAAGIRRWFRPPWLEPPRDPAPPDLKAVATTLERAVEKRLMSDVSLGVFLSGGLDSSIIAALVRRHVDALHSFAVGLDGSPDLMAARAVARHLGTQHHECIYTPADAIVAVDPVIRHLESCDLALLRSAIPCYFVSRLAAEHVKVVLSGEGSDEAFAGYRYFGDLDDPSALHRESVDLLHGLHNLNLQRVDRMTMAHGLEARVPFLDVDFLDLAMSLDPQQKLHQVGRQEKWLLREAFVGMLPDDILGRTKQEFAQGCGSEWTLHEHCEQVLDDQELARASEAYPEHTPETKEALVCRRIFERHFPGEAPHRTVGRWRGHALMEVGHA